MSDTANSRQLCLYQSYRMAQTRGSIWFGCVKKVVLVRIGVVRLQKEKREEMFANKEERPSDACEREY